MCRINTHLGRLKLLNFTFDLDVEFKKSHSIDNRGFVSFVPRPFLLRVVSRAISNMAHFRLPFRDISQLIRVNRRRRRLVMQVASNYVLARRSHASGGFSCFAVATFGTKHRTCPFIIFKNRAFHENRIAHFKHVYLVGEKQELHIASDFRHFVSPEPRMAFRKKGRIVGKT